MGDGTLIRRLEYLEEEYSHYICIYFTYHILIVEFYFLHIYLHEPTKGFLFLRLQEILNNIVR